MSYTYGTVTNCKVANGQTRDEYECRLGYQVDSQSTANNTSKVTLRLEVRSISSSYNTYGLKQTTKIDGTSLSAASFDMRDTKTWKVFGTRTITISHNSDGTYSGSKSGSFTTTASSGYSLKSGSASVTVKPKNIPRYATSVQSLKSKTVNSITMNWSSDSTIDYIWYSKDNGSSWTGINVSDGKSGSYTISSLTPNTTYKIKTRVRRKDSQLTTDSSVSSIATYDIARLTTYPNFNLGDSVTVKYSNPSGAPVQVGLYKDSSTALAAYRTATGGSYTFNFTDAELDAIYKAMSGNSIKPYFYINTNNNAYRENKQITVTLTGNQKTARVNVNGAWKRGKYYININGTWKRAVQWININGTWKRSI